MEKILIIDDNKDILQGLGEICKLKNWEPHLANNVNKGLAVLKAETIDIIIIDYHMPLINGLIGVKKIREIYKDIPIIVLTVDEDQELADKFLLAGANDFALKPIKIPDFLSRISVHLRHSKVHQGHKIQQQYPKGINEYTVEAIKEYMKNKKEAMTIDEVSEATGYAYQTTHRYINYLIEVNVVEIAQSIGKRGRPKQKYRYI
ncbi:response regulator [Natronincola ferrireducens]|uniref:Stage 0 sporulation protein A homolog n=1 Tax=Natronincola ferrireducens TaxID=393762 RepID=A0A1G9FRC0_9FIRM|nr:response regulator [Natronincola ferrireducens]SDK90885.1 hypothetical protein SAMN05660472_02220 [Natronincola ferrireducens]